MVFSSNANVCIMFNWNNIKLLPVYIASQPKTDALQKLYILERVALNLTIQQKKGHYRM